MPYDAQSRSVVTTLVRASRGVRISLAVVALASTSLRLYLRGLRRWQWDDAFVSLGCFWMILKVPISTIVESRFIPTPARQHADQSPLFFVSYLLFLCVLWSGRVSILQSIVRITPVPVDRKRRQMVAALFAVLFILQIGQALKSCIPNAEWGLESYAPTCISTREYPILHLISTAFSDTPLLVFPLLTLRGLRNNLPRIRTRLSMAFMASACTTVLSIAGGILALYDQSLIRWLTSLLEAEGTLVICNLPVLVVAFYHAFGIRDFCRQDDRTLPPIVFVPKQRNSECWTDDIPISTDDVARSSSSWGAFSQVIPTASASTLPIQTSGAPNSEQATSFLGQLKSFAAEEDACEDEGRAFRERMQFDLHIEKVLRDLDRTTERGRKSKLGLRRHSV